ncbi:class C sortase [Corynebacterium auriscanis]|uniref:class C sortase n=1 Tax=Corynebacterium auriscanis TaxID=99807 RepID=UPI00069198DB|nr:class C sortase [Corynebacterium auriscanis]WJY72241.1 Sortase family protein [Corynebacterium auriscanis]
MSARHQRRATQRGTAGSRRSVVYIVLGILVLLAPVILTHYKNVEQNRIAQGYSRDVQALTPEQRSQALESARQYNRELPPFGAPDPWVNGVDVNSPGYKKYLRQLNVNTIMARLQAPTVGMDLPVYHGTSQNTLSHGIGHLYGTDLPVGGKGTHSVLTGHTGLATLTMFDNLTHMKKDDIFVIEVMGEKLAYKVDQIHTVLPSEINQIRPEEGKDYVTLVTCTPYGVNSHRLLVRGERTKLPPGPIEQEYHSPWQPWMIAALVISLAALLYLLWWLWRRRRKKNEDQAPQAQGQAGTKVQKVKQ